MVFSFEQPRPLRARGRLIRLALKFELNYLRHISKAYEWCMNHIRRDVVSAILPVNVKPGEKS